MGYTVLNGLDIAPGESATERRNYGYPPDKQEKATKDSYPKQ